ncbi:hypothetical protein LTR17_025107 [Elasticomyces elasticus]|nr:hypothetical protein LTR17_025107 [Elasticomyces elasticus]
MYAESVDYTGDDMEAIATSLFFQRFIRPTQAAPRSTQQGIYSTSERPFPALRRLGLQHAFIGGPAAFMLCRAFSITQLTSLTLQYCSDIVPLLKLLVSNQGLLFEHLVIMAEDTCTTPRLSMKALLDSLLGGFGSLQTLVLNINQFEVPTLETNRMPSVWAIGQHSATLKVLSLDFDDESKPLEVVAWGNLASFIPGELSPLPHVQPPLLDGTHDCDSWGGMQVFTRSEKHDLVGGIDVVASVPKERLKYYEPAVEVLDVIQPVDGFLRFG